MIVFAAPKMVVFCLPGLFSTAGVWVSNREGEENLLLRCYIIDEFLATVKMCVVFKGDTVTIVMHKFAELFLQEYEGFASGSLETV